MNQTELALMLTDLSRERTELARENNKLAKINNLLAFAIYEEFDNSAQTRATSSLEFNYFPSEKPSLLLVVLIGFCRCAGN